MVLINPPPPALSADTLSAFYATDELLSSSPTLVLYGPSATTTALPTNSRIQVHIYTSAGFQSFPRLTVSPSSPLYTAVTCLAREEQGDEICRGLAFSLYKYFTELSEGIKNVWAKRSSVVSQLPSAPSLFSDSHAAILASRMTKLENTAEVIEDLKLSLAQQTLAWIDLDVVVPTGSMRQLSDNIRESNLFDATEEDTTNLRYGDIAPLVKLFGQPTFLPTSRLKRAPSRPTALNRTLTFTRKQKENLRREMIELLDTEESYVSKVYDLLHSVAEDFRQKAKKKTFSSASPSEQVLKGLFPPSLDQILEVNSSFLESIRQVLDDSEDDAIKDLEATSDDPDEVPPLNPSQNDVTGALKLAQCLIDWFPKFADCYTEYIQAHGEFSGFLRIFLKETGSSFSKRVQETGEQRLMSMLIEPVQRLPRYNLYIDNIVKQLPVRHPALKSFLKARDVVSEICARESTGSQQIKLINSLRRLVASLPPDFHPRGRFITAADMTELAPPYRPMFQGPGASPGVFLLFTDSLIVLRKLTRRSTNARGIMAEIDGSTMAESATHGSSQPDLVFVEEIKLSDAFLSEVNEGKMIQIATKNTNRAEQGSPRIFNLALTYEARASKFVEEFVKARVEGRFSEAERESSKWEARSVSGDLGLFSAIFEEAIDPKSHRPGGLALVRFTIEPSMHKELETPSDKGVELAASLANLGDSFFQLELIGLNGYTTRDRLTAGEFIPVLTKRLANFFHTRIQIRNPSMTVSLLIRNQQILSSLRVSISKDDADSLNEKTPRTASPVKMLSNLFGGSREGGSFRKTRPLSTLSDSSRFFAPSSSRPQSRDSESQSRPQSAGVTSTGQIVNLAAESINKLEDTFCAYLLALHSRKGNVVGKNIRNRASADELAVNELYNALLEDPTNHESAAHAPVDVVFAAFEKFIKNAWREKMGPIMPRVAIESIQSKSDSSYPGEFEEIFRQVYADLSPQTQRALQSTVKLLADLLGGTGNDSDRGILTASFAELLVPDGNAHDFISLLDRFIEDVDVLFATQGTTTPNKGSLNAETRNRVANSGSLSSNTSSIRKKLGFGGLTRENSKSDLESKFGSVFRTLSKTTRDTKGAEHNQAASISRGPLVRSRSTDVDGRVSPKRPSSRDRPAVLGAFAFEDDSTYSGRSFLSGLDTIGEVPVKQPSPRKKRRSSLSDLKSLQGTAPNTPSWSPQTPSRPGHARQNSASPATPTRPKGTQIPVPAPLSPPLGRTSPTKENIPTGTQRQHSPLKATPASSVGDEVTITSRSPTKRRGKSVSGIPSLKPFTTAPPALSERPSSGNTNKLPPSEQKTPLPPSPTKKLRMQSPQKLRERLQKEQKAISTASPLLQAELSKIGDEIASTANISPTRSTRSNTIHSSPSKSSTSSSQLTPLIGRVATLESRVSNLISENTARTNAIAKDVASSLQVSETKARKLDELYREANAENEALYAKFNDELVRIVRGVRTGDGGEELKRLLKQSQEEVAVLKRENGRLKRENLGLRAQLKE